MDDKSRLVMDLRSALKSRDAFRLRELSNECSDIAFVAQEKDVINIGVISYAFHKIILKTHYVSQFGSLLEDTYRKLDAGDFEGIMEEIKNFDVKHGFFQGNVVKKARIKMGARLYTKGISLSRAAELVSVNVSDILKYVGGTQVHEKATGSLEKRLSTARNLFR